jgi:hypothetical protein
MCDFNAENDPRSQIIHMKKIQAEGLELFIKKNADYGNSYKQYGLIGVLVRLQDKINRALNITKNGIHVKDESLRDTLIDLHNYAAMALMESEPTVPSLEHPRTPVERAQIHTGQISQVSHSSQHEVRCRNKSGSENDTTRLPRKSISDSPFKTTEYDSDEAYEECNHRNINLR